MCRYERGGVSVTESAAQLNMRAVFLHVLGDALGSVVVIISAILIKFLEEDWKYKIDPVLRYIYHSIIRPSVRSNGRSYKMLVVFFLCRR